MKCNTWCECEFNLIKWLIIHFIIWCRDNLQITNAAAQQQDIANLKTSTTTEQVAARSGTLQNSFDASKVLRELNIQVAVTQEFQTNALNAISQYVEPKQEALRKQIKETTDEYVKTQLYD